MSVSVAAAGFVGAVAWVFRRWRKKNPNPETWVGKSAAVVADVVLLKLGKFGGGKEKEGEVKE